MRNLFIFLMTLCLSLQGHAGAVIFSGQDVKSLKANLDLNGQGKLMSGTTHPLETPIAAPMGSIYLHSETGKVYKKITPDASTSAWVEMQNPKQRNLVKEGEFDYLPNNASANSGEVPGVSVRGTTAPTVYVSDSVDINLKTSPIQTKSLYVSGLNSDNGFRFNLNKSFSGELYKRNCELHFRWYSSATDGAPLSTPVKGRDLVLSIVQTAPSSATILGSRTLTANTGLKEERIIFPCPADFDSEMYVDITGSEPGSRGDGYFEHYFFDNVELGITDSIGGVQVIDDWKSTTTTIGAVTTAPTKPTGLASDKLYYRRVGDGYEVRLDYRQSNTTGAAAGSGHYLFSLPPGCTADTSKVSAYTGSNVYSVPILGHGSATNSTNGHRGFGAVLYDTTRFRLLGLNAANSLVYVGSSDFPLNGDASIAYYATFHVPCAGMTATSQAVRSDQTNYGWTQYTPTFQGFGTPSNIECFHSRDGQDLLIRCKFVAGTTSAVQARIGLPNGLRVAGTDIVPSITSVGRGAGSSAASTDFGVKNILAQAGLDYLLVGNHNSGAGFSTNAQTGSSVCATGGTFQFTARVPIEGWTETQNAPILVGGVTQPGNGSDYHVRFTTNAASSCAISRNNATPTVSRTGTGTCSANLSTYFPRNDHTCTCSPVATTGSTYSCHVEYNSSTATVFRYVRRDDNLIDGAMSVQCSGSMR